MLRKVFNPPFIDWFIALLLFCVALCLRSTNLVHFITADEHSWVTWSGQFLRAMLLKDWPGTYVWYTPAVTTTWLGSLGQAAYYYLNQDTINRPFLEWLVSFPRNRIDLDVLWPMRWAVALYTSLMIAVIYGLARKLWALPVALLGTILLATEPHILSISRIIGHDAPVTHSVIASLLAILYAKRLLDADTGQTNRNWVQKVVGYRWFMVSGMFAGLAVLSKVPALFLIPFVGLMALIDAALERRKFKNWLWAFFIWGGVLGLTFVLLWPAAWANPLGRVWGLIETAFLTSTGLEDPDIQPFWAIPNLGLFYYPVHAVFKMSPFLTIGLMFAGVGGWLKLRGETHRLRILFKSEYFWLLLFAILFGTFMTLGLKKSPRYVLPAFPGLVFVAAWGWLEAPLWRRFWRYSWWKPGLVAILGSLSVVLTLQYAPYYFTYFNPLLGGAYTAPKVVKIGWGEGVDELGRWLDSKSDASVGHVGTRYTSSIHPFYRGAVSSPVSEELDYVAFYIKHTQSGYPAPEILAYFDQQELLHRVELNGIEYVRLYQGPGMQLVETSGQSNLPLAYRPRSPYASAGQDLAVDLLWSDDSARPVGESVTLVLQSPNVEILADSSSQITEGETGVKVSRHHLKLPADIPRDTYNFLVDGSPIGEIKVRLLQIPSDMAPSSAVMAGQLKLAGYRYLIEGDYLGVELAWQAWPQAHNDYTVFVQLIDEAGQRVAGVDVAPELGFTNLDRKEIMIDRYAVPLPPDLPPGTYSLLTGLYYFAGDQLINIGVATLDEFIVIE